jgi:hypothetical protein
MNAFAFAAQTVNPWLMTAAVMLGIAIPALVYALTRVGAALCSRSLEVRNSVSRKASPRARSPVRSKSPPRPRPVWRMIKRQRSTRNSSN